MNEEVINRVTTLPLRVRWKKEERIEVVISKKNIFLPKENPIEDKNGVTREILPYPWDEVAYYVFKYISCDEILNIIYSYQFRMLF